MRIGSREMYFGVTCDPDLLSPNPFVA
jgi:hypothetical protein